MWPMCPHLMITLRVGHAVEVDDRRYRRGVNAPRCCVTSGSVAAGESGRARRTMPLVRLPCGAARRARPTVSTSAMPSADGRDR